MKIVKIAKSPFFFICCLLLIILWLLLSHHDHDHTSWSSSRSVIKGTQISHTRPEILRLLSNLLKEAATENREVIITMVDGEWAKPGSILDLFLESFRIGERTKHLLNHLIVVALDDQALRYCLRVHPKCYLPHIYYRRKSESLNPDGLLTSWSKKSLIKDILEIGYNIMFTEADVMWLKNPLLYYDPGNSISVACGLSSSDHHQQQHLTMENTGGIFYAKSSDITIDLFKTLNFDRIVYPSTANQSFCDIVKRKDIIGLDMHVTYLDDANFGRFCQSYPQDQSKMATVHASCCNNTISKVHYLKLLLQDRKNMNSRWIIPSQC